MSIIVRTVPGEEPLRSTIHIPSTAAPTDVLEAEKYTALGTDPARTEDATAYIYFHPPIAAKSG